MRALHTWPATEREAIAIQRQFCDQVIVSGTLDHARSVAGIETAYDISHNLLHVAATVFSYPDLELLERTVASDQIRFPYIPGLHAFREGPVMLNAIADLTTAPDVYMFSGHGIAHPRRFGLASHLGVILGMPSIGVSRRLLTGSHQPLGPLRNDAVPLLLGNDQVGVVYRSRERVKPIYISPGHLCGIDDAVKITIACLREFRLPEPLREAHRVANWTKHRSMANALR